MWLLHTVLLLYLWFPVKESTNFNWVDMCIPFFILFQKNIIAMLIRAHNGPVSSYMFLYLWIDKSNLPKGFLFSQQVRIYLQCRRCRSSIHWVEDPGGELLQPLQYAYLKSLADRGSLSGLQPRWESQRVRRDWLTKQAIYLKLSPSFLWAWLSPGFWPVTLVLANLCALLQRHILLLLSERWFYSMNI